MKVILHARIVECLDVGKIFMSTTKKGSNWNSVITQLYVLITGNFPHPLNCRSFISCSKINDSLRGHVFSCPKGLTFDPVGGICNWASKGISCNSEIKTEI